MAQNNPDVQPAPAPSVDPGLITLEGVLDKIAEALIVSPIANKKLIQQNQKTFRDGILKIGRTSGENLQLYQTDVAANVEDTKSTNNDGNNPQTLQNIVDSLEGFMDEVVIDILTFSDNTLEAILLTNQNFTWELTPLLTSIQLNDDGSETILNPLNVGQFTSLDLVKNTINPDLADEFLNTTIYELLPGLITRQSRIDALFQELQNLIGDAPDFLIENGMVGDNFDPDVYSEMHDISTAQDGDPEIGIDEEESFITRLNQNSNENNIGKTIQSLRDTCNSYLVDIDEQPKEPIDDREEYVNKSDGYLKFRSLNQGIIIRNTNDNFIQGLNPEPTVREYLTTGFTVTMWVRFLDDISQGTLFNFGNPLREDNPFGFMLETYVINGDDAVDPTAAHGSDPNRGDTWSDIFSDGNKLNMSWDGGEEPNEGFFSKSGGERFVRLVIREGNNFLRGSHIGAPWYKRDDRVPQFGKDYNEYSGMVDYDHEFGLMTNTRIPVNYSEWYFICATYNPNVMEDASHTGTTYNDYNTIPDFWRNNVDKDLGLYVNNSNYGAKCKVEIISRSDLLRARGFKVE